MEAPIIRIIPSSVRQLPVVNVVLAAAIPLHNAHQDEQQQENGNGHQHANEPASGGHIMIGHLQGTIYK